MRALKRGVTIQCIANNSALLLEGIDGDDRPFSLFLNGQELSIINEAWKEGERSKDSASSYDMSYERL